MVRPAQESSDLFISRGVQAEVFGLEDKLETSDDHHGLLYLCGAGFSRNSTFKESKKFFFKINILILRTNSIHIYTCLL